MGGYLAVQQGSKFPPQFIHLKYTSASQSDNKRKKVALVGKGLTFDSGGYNLKVGLCFLSSLEFLQIKSLHRSEPLHRLR
jgi:leucyl aminopeptidase